MRCICLLVVLSTLALIHGTTLGDSDHAERPPNIILFFTDDLGLAELGCTGSRRIETPNIDRLRSRGMLFTRAYSGSTVCAPSRCTLLTGLHTGHAQIRDNHEVKNHPDGTFAGQRPLVAGTSTLPLILGDNGYATAGVGKWGLGGPGTEGVPNKQGFDFWFGYLCQRNAHNFYPEYIWKNQQKYELEENTRGLTGAQYSPDLMADEAAMFIRDHKDEPFFLYYATIVPHLALQVPEDSLARYDGRWPETPYPGGRGYLPHDKPRAAYAAMVTRFDRDVGRIMDLVGELGLEDETLFIFTSDNGSTFDLGGYDKAFFNGTGGLRGHKTNLYEGGIRVPLIVSWPGAIEPGSQSDLLVANWDLMPTILSAAGIDSSAPTDGIDIMPTLTRSGDQQTHDHLYWEFHSGGGQQAVRDDRYKAVRMNAKRGGAEPVALYDLDLDPAERNDVSADHPEITTKLTEIMNSRTPSPHADWNFDMPARTSDQPAAVPEAMKLAWTGEGDGTRFLDPANWTSADGTGRMLQLNRSRLSDTFTVDDEEAVIGGRRGMPQLDFVGGRLILHKGTMTGNAGLAGADVTITGGSLQRRFMLDSNIDLSGDGRLVLTGPGNPLNRSMVLLGPGASLVFTQESPDEVRREHLGKIRMRGIVGEGRDLIRIEPMGEGRGSIVYVESPGSEG